METYTPEQITQDIWETFQTMWDSKTSPIYKQKENEYSYLTLNTVDPGGEQLTETRAKELILQAVKESLKTHNIVFLYYCPDNQEIALELTEPEEYLELFHPMGTNYYTAKD